MPPSGPGHSVSDHDAERNAHRIASRRIAALEIIPVGFRRGAAIISWIRGELSDFRTGTRILDARRPYRHGASAAKIGSEICSGPPTALRVAVA